MNSMGYFLLAFVLVGAAIAQKNGDSCTHSGVMAQDDAACGTHANNMYCGTGSTCVCADVYGSSTAHFTIAADKMSCVQA